MPDCKIIITEFSIIHWPAAEEPSPAPSQVSGPGPKGRHCCPRRFRRILNKRSQRRQAIEEKEVNIYFRAEEAGAAADKTNSDSKH